MKFLSSKEGMKENTDRKAGKELSQAVNEETCSVHNSMGFFSLRFYVWGICQPFKFYSL